MMRFPCRIWLALLAGSLTTACTEDPPLSLSGEDRAMVDTLYSRQVDGLRQELDSLCDLLMERELQATIDSMLRVRRAEEEALRRRIPVTDE